jgi:hypothetical protein
MKRTLTGILCLLLITGTAAAARIKDNFNDNARNADLWQVEENRIDVREKNKRLETRSSAAGGGIRESGFVANGWEFDYTKNYTVKVDFDLGVGPVGGNKWAAVGFRAFPSGQVGKVYVGVERYSGGIRVTYESFAPNGSSLYFESEDIAQTSGTLKITYRAGSDRFKVFINGASKITIPHFLQGIDTGNGRASAGLGAQRNGFVPWAWDEAWLDNFVLTGTIID